MLSRFHVGLTNSCSVSFWLIVSLVVPFALLEWINSSPTEEGFSVVLLEFMTIHASLSGLLLAPALARFRRIAALAPCFMGVPTATELMR